MQTITIPAISVWAVAALANGDFACAASDGIVRVFSQEEHRWADKETLAVSWSQLPTSRPLERASEARAMEVDARARTAELMLAFLAHRRTMQPLHRKHSTRRK